MFTSIRHRLGAGPLTRVAPAREVRVRVRGGYVPDTIRAEVGVPLRIVFRREESSACSELVVFPAFGKSASLPQGEPVAVDLLPSAPGEYEFTCAMGMLRGKILVSSGGRANDPIPLAQASAPTTPVGGRRS
jgi:plastocyanin domain-containing protein